MKNGLHVLIKVHLFSSRKMVAQSPFDAAVGCEACLDRISVHKKIAISVLDGNFLHRFDAVCRIEHSHYRLGSKKLKNGD